MCFVAEQYMCVASGVAHGPANQSRATMETEATRSFDWWAAGSGHLARLRRDQPLDSRVFTIAIYLFVAHVFSFGK